MFVFLPVPRVGCSASSSSSWHMSFKRQSASHLPRAAG